MKKYQKFTGLFTLTILSLSFSGCFSFGGGTDTPTGDQTTLLYDAPGFQVTYPRDWEVINQDEFTSDIPSETQVVFRNNVKNETWTANVTVVKKNLQETLSSLEFAKQVINRQSSGLISYRETRKEEIKIRIGNAENTTYFTAFEAQRSAGDKLIRYVQIYGVRGNEGYIILGSYSPQENDATAQMVERIVRSFVLK